MTSLHRGRGRFVGARPAWGPAALVAALALSAPSASAQGRPGAVGVGSIRGTVTDAATTLPVTAARVRLVELHREYLTHEDGAFTFADVPAGRYTISVRRLGYVVESRAVAVAAGASVTASFALRASPVQLSTSVVTGTVTERERQDVLSPTSVLTNGALDRQLEATVAQTLQGQPGVAVTSMGPAVSRPVIRGLSGDRILVLEDGQRPGDVSSTGADHAVAVDPLTARQFEVVRGPMSLLYGSSALGGVINVVRDEVPGSLPEHVHGTASAQASSVNRGGTAGGFVAGRAGNVALRAEGSARGAGDLATPVGRLLNTNFRAYNGALGASYVRGAGHLGASYRFYRNDYGIPGGFVGAHPTGVDIEMRRHTLRLEGELHRGLGPFESVRSATTFTDYAHAEQEASGEIGTQFSQEFAATDLVARHGRLGSLASGAVGFRGQFRNIVTGGSLRTPSTRDYTLAAFVVEEVGTGPVRMQGGLRFDWARYEPQERQFVTVRDERIPTDPRTFGSASGSLGLLWVARADLRVGASVSRAYRTPDFNELYSDGPHLAAYSYDVGNPRLGEETGVGVDAFVRLTRENVRAEVAAFRNALSGYVYPRNTGELGRQGGRPKFQFTGEDVLLTGAEGEVEWSVSPHVVLDATLSYVSGRIRGEPDSLPAIDEQPAQLGSRYLPFIPPLNGRVGVRYDRPRWFAGVGTRFAARQTRIGDFETPTAGYALGEANAGVRLLVGDRLHTITLRIDNVFDKEYRDHLSRTKLVMPEAGRDVSLVYRLSF